MKKILIVFSVFTLFVSATQAQVRLGAKAGASFTTFSGKKSASWNNEIVSGYFLGPTFEVMFKEAFGLETSVIYAEREMNSSNMLKSSSLQIPVNLKAKLNIYDNFIPFVSGGPQVNIKLAGSDVVLVNELGEQMQWDTKPLGASFVFGVGVEVYQHVQLSVNYELGVTDVYKQTDGRYSLTGRTWFVTAAYYF